MREHAPGPWTLTYYDDMRVAMICNADDEVLLYLEDVGASEADLRLVAAAPDLLAALVEMVEEAETLIDLWSGGTSRPMPRAMDRAEAAIAKARGHGEE